MKPQVSLACNVWLRDRLKPASDHVGMDTSALHDGKRLELLMERAGISRAALASVFEPVMSVQGIGKWIKTGDIARERIPLICKTLMCSSDELLGLRPIGMSPATPTAKGDESHLLSMYRQLNQRSREQVLQWIAALVTAALHAN